MLQYNFKNKYNMFKKRKVVMPPTNEKATSAIMVGVMPNVAAITKDVIDDIDDWMRFGKPQHLYILSDEKIEEGDWYYSFIHNKVFQGFRNAQYHKNEFKIIASTDEALGLPQPSTAFIEKYIAEYNKGNIITHVMVEYEYNYAWPNKIIELKVVSDNTITAGGMRWLDLEVEIFKNR